MQKPTDPGPNLKMLLENNSELEDAFTDCQSIGERILQSNCQSFDPGDLKKPTACLIGCFIRLVGIIGRDFCKP